MKHSRKGWLAACIALAMGSLLSGCTHVDDVLKSSSLESLDLTTVSQAEVTTNEALAIDVVSDPYDFYLQEAVVTSDGGDVMWDYDTHRMVFYSMTPGRYTVSLSDDGIKSNQLIITVVSDPQTSQTQTEDESAAETEDSSATQQESADQAETADESSGQSTQENTADTGDESTANQSDTQDESADSASQNPAERDENQNTSNAAGSSTDVKTGDSKTEDSSEDSAKQESSASTDTETKSSKDTENPSKSEQSSTSGKIVSNEKVTSGIQTTAEVPKAQVIKTGKTTTTEDEKNKPAVLNEEQSVPVTYVLENKKFLISQGQSLNWQTLVYGNIEKKPVDGQEETVLEDSDDPSDYLVLRGMDVDFTGPGAVRGILYEKDGSLYFWVNYAIDENSAKTTGEGKKIARSGPYTNVPKCVMPSGLDLPESVSYYYEYYGKTEVIGKTDKTPGFDVQEVPANSNAVISGTIAKIKDASGKDICVLEQVDDPSLYIILEDYTEAYTGEGEVGGTLSETDGQLYLKVSGEVEQGITTVCPVCSGAECGEE